MAKDSQAKVEHRLAVWERRQPAFYLGAPYVLLAIAFATSIAIPPATVAARVAVGCLVIASAAWEYLFWTSRPAPRADLSSRYTSVYLSGHMLIAASLVWLQPWFALATWFLLLRSVEATSRKGPRWGFLLATAAILGFGQCGGQATVLHGGWFAWPALFLVNAGIGGAMVQFEHVSEVRGEQRLRDIERLQESNSRLESALAENAGLHVQLVAQAREAGITDERQRMAREIHDTIAQGLAGVITQLEAADQSVDDEARSRHLEVARSIARESLTEARRSVHALQPAPLEEARLPEAVTALAKHWAEVNNVNVDVRVTGESFQILADLEVALYRVTQESLTNIAKHASSGNVVLTLSYMDYAVALDVRDDGTGFDKDARVGASALGGYGLRAMRDRIERAGGEFSLDSTPGEGTTVSAVVPVTAQPAVQGES
ncbi:histidine kinase/DNA gyrase B/HSP90-like ATPase [Antricoccus suffuscus]|uniref:Oxygen sensor histidine kinase NreB n=1 Tax=Antricoccus suffuscus TaxID=1629062 RepID=A0A2T1A6I2_9ACTN|nr:sensor histidine kinase [Antricoccus suffuscus]PRZ44164.1 histidine kinase/DNA gyrase B/HSP90-like ATPase [Antricoccus suffuscus]